MVSRVQNRERQIKKSARGESSGTLLKTLIIIDSSSAARFFIKRSYTAATIITIINKITEVDFENS